MQLKSPPPSFVKILSNFRMSQLQESNCSVKMSGEKIFKILLVSYTDYSCFFCANKSTLSRFLFWFRILQNILHAQFCCFLLTCQARNRGQKRPDRSSSPPLRPAAPLRILWMKNTAKVIQVSAQQDGRFSKKSPCFGNVFLCG